jgi:hypothetical protein
MTAVKSLLLFCFVTGTICSIVETSPHPSTPADQQASAADRAAIRAQATADSALGQRQYQEYAIEGKEVDWSKIVCSPTEWPTYFCPSPHPSALPYPYYPLPSITTETDKNKHTDDDSKSDHQEL